MDVVNNRAGFLHDCSSRDSTVGLHSHTYMASMLQSRAGCPAVRALQQWRTVVNAGKLLKHCNVLVVLLSMCFPSFFRRIAPTRHRHKNASIRNCRASGRRRWQWHISRDLIISLTVKDEGMMKFIISGSAASCTNTCTRVEQYTSPPAT